jgi:choline dehydrogenase-like flavoprotein
MPTMQAKALGGGSLVNSAICRRAPGFVLDRWAEEHGLPDLGAGSLDADYAAVESFFGVAPSDPSIAGERNELFVRGCRALGWKAEPMPRNVRGCRGSAECLTGCRNGAKQSTDVTCVPEVLRRGGRVYSSVRAELLVRHGRRVTAVRGHAVEPFTERAGPPVEIEARRVFLAAGCMATPLLMIRSGLGGSGHVGRHLQAHPGFAVMGIYDHPVDPWRGATQGFDCLDFLREGMKLEVLWAPAALLALRFPGTGAAFKEHLGTFSRMAPFDVIVSANDSEGEVRPRRGSFEPTIRYSLDLGDAAKLMKGVVRLTEICWAAGAQAVLTGIHGLPDVLRSPDQTRLLREHALHPRDAAIGANHVFGTTRMGGDPRSSVADSRGRVHGMDNLYVADTGLFPGSTGVNPMLTCMALARRVAQSAA